LQRAEGGIALPFLMVDLSPVAWGAAKAIETQNAGLDRLRRPERSKIRQQACRVFQIGVFAWLTENM